MRAALALLAWNVACSAALAQPAAAPQPKAEQPKAEQPKAEQPKKEQPKAEPPAAAPELPAGYPALVAAWDTLEAKLDDVADAYRKAFSSDTRKKILEEYQPLQEQAKRLLPALEKAAKAECERVEQPDARLTQLLLGFASQAVRQDRYEDALALAQLLRSKGVTDPALHYVVGVSAYCTQDLAVAEKELTAAKEAGVLRPEDQPLLSDLPELIKQWEVEQQLRKQETEADDLPQVKLVTNQGEVVVELFENQPQTVANFIHLVKSKFYDGLTFHRVLGGFMAQGGCPDGTGGGGPGYEIYCECGKEGFRRHFRGTLSMAHAGKDTGGSQFFLTFRPTPGLDSRHTAFGRVIAGLDVLAKIQRRNPNMQGQPEPDKILSAEVIRDRGHEYEPTKVEKKKK